MTKMVNCWNEWDPLKRVILGEAAGTNLPAPEPSWMHHHPEGGYPLGYYGPFPEELVAEAEAQQEGFAKQMEKRGIIVDRVTVHPSMLDGRGISTPDWSAPVQHGVSNPRDLFLPVGNEIMEAPGSRRSRFYEYLCLRDLFEMYFREDPEFLWTSAPRPRLTNESFEDKFWHNYFHVWTREDKMKRCYDWKFQLTDKEPLWDAADAARAGKDIFWQCSSVTNRAGLDWVTRYFEPKGINIHPIQFEYKDMDYFHPWHIDVLLVMLHPGLVVICGDCKPITPYVVELFKKNDWEMVEAVKPSWEWNEPLSLCSDWDGVRCKSIIAQNTLSLGPNEICVDEHETPFCDQLDKLGMEVIPVAYDKVYKFGGMLHCTTLDIYREGKCEDYFPNR